MLSVFTIQAVGERGLGKLLRAIRVLGLKHDSKSCVSQGIRVLGTWTSVTIMNENGPLLPVTGGTSYCGWRKPCTTLPDMPYTVGVTVY